MLTALQKLQSPAVPAPSCLQKTSAARRSAASWRSIAPKFSQVRLLMRSLAARLHTSSQTIRYFMNQVPTTIVDFTNIVPNILDLPFEQAARPAARLRRQE